MILLFSYLHTPICLLFVILPIFWDISSTLFSKSFTEIFIFCSWSLNILSSWMQCLPLFLRLWILVSWCLIIFAVSVASKFFFVCLFSIRCCDLFFMLEIPSDAWWALDVNLYLRAVPLKVVWKLWVCGWGLFVSFTRDDLIETRHWGALRVWLLRSLFLDSWDAVQKSL